MSLHESNISPSNPFGGANPSGFFQYDLSLRAGGDSEILERLEHELAQLPIPAPAPDAAPYGHQLAFLQEALKTEVAFSAFVSEEIKQIESSLRQNTIELHQLLAEIRVMNSNIRKYYRGISSAHEVEADPAKLHQMGVSREVREDLVNWLLNIKSRPDVIVAALEAHRYFVNSFNEKLVEALVFSVFNPFTPKEELMLLRVLGAVFERQVQLRGHLSNRFLQELFLAYFQSVDGYQYLRQLLYDVLTDVLENPSLVLKCGSAEEMRILFPNEKPEVFAEAPVQLKRYVERVRTRIESQLGGLPYGIRWLTQELARIGKTEGKSQGEVEALQFDLLYYNIYIPAILHPERFGIITGVLISPAGRANLKAIADSFMRMDDQARDLLGRIVFVESLEDHFELPPSSLFEQSQPVTFMLFNKEQMESLVKLFHEPGEGSDQRTPLPRVSDSTLAWLPKFSADKSVILNCSRATAHEEHPPSSQPVEEAKRILKDFLVSIDNIRGSKHRTVFQVLLAQSGSNWHLEKITLLTQLHQVVSSLSSLSKNHSDNDFKTLLDEMLNEHQQRMSKMLSKIRSLKLFNGDKVIFVRKLRNRRRLFSQCLAHIKVRALYKLTDFALFHSQFVERFCRNYDPNTNRCSYHPLKSRQNVSCEHCLSQQKDVTDHLTWLKKVVFSEYANSSEEEKNTILQIAQKRLMEDIYKSAYPFTYLDGFLSGKIQRANLTYSDFDIPESLPLKHASEELRAMAAFKDPYEKLQCIIRTWAAIKNVTGPAEPDLLLSVMAFLIYSVQPKDVISDIQYITLFTTPYLLMDFVSAIVHLERILDNRLDDQYKRDRD